MSKQRWSFGNYTFKINPNKFSQKTSLIGDNVRTLNGSYIAQPTTFQSSYDVSSIFYQPKTKLVSQVSMPNSLYVDYYISKLRYYCLSNHTNAIYIYSNNFAYINTINFPVLISGNYVGFDVYNGYYWILCHSTNSSVETLYKIDMGTNAITSTYSITMSNSNQSLAIEILNGTLWILRPNNVILKMNSDNVTVNTSYIINNNTITCLTSDGSYLIFAGNNTNNNPISFYFDNGKVITSIYCSDSINQCDDVCFDGSNLIYFNKSNNTLSIVRPNTTDVDIYNFEQQLDNNHGYVQMFDDTGLYYNISISNYSRNRLAGYEYAYDVSFTVDKVDRGGNG